MTTGSCTTTAQMVGKINTHPVASLYVTAVETNAGAYDDATATMPAVVATATNFTGGVAGVGSVTDAQYETALTYFLDSYGTGIICTPDVPTTTIQTYSGTISNASHNTDTNTTTYTTSAAHGLIAGETVTIAALAHTAFNGSKVVASVPTATTFTVSFTTAQTLSDTEGTYEYTRTELNPVAVDVIAHCNTHSRIAALHGEATDSTSEIRSLAQLVQASDNAEHVAVYYPWVSAPTGTPGVNRWIPPVGYAAGARARAHNQIGPHQPGAGIISDARFVNGVYTSIDKTTGDALDADCVNAIRIINNRVRIYGARSCSSDTTNFRYLNAQDVVNYVVVQANRTLEDVLFSIIDGRGGMFASIEARLVAVMVQICYVGGVFYEF
jgi:phage tail sheath protein FI